MAKASILRRLALLEANRPVRAPSCTDPATGEAVQLGELLYYATSGELDQFRAIRLCQIGEHIDAKERQESRRTLAPAAFDAITNADADELSAFWKKLLAVAFARRRRDPEWRWKSFHDQGEPYVAPWPIPAVTR